MKILKGIHTAYGVVVFTVLFIFFFPLLLIPILFPSKFKLIGVFNRWWARSMFFLIGIPIKLTYESELDPKKQYIFCPNHFSYLDIPTMGLNTHNAIFVGKSAMEKIPLFGFMYRKLHITVDRTKLKSRYSTLLQTFSALDEGKSLIIFPEGGIVTERDPVMASFKDGAFRASVEKQIPIVPVTIPFNWIILPADEFLVTWNPLEVIFHKPIDPSQYTLDTIPLYKENVRGIINAALKQKLKHEDRPAIA